MNSLNLVNPICAKTRSCFSAYLHGAFTGKRMQEIARHLESCDDCTQEFSALRTMQQSLAALGSVKAPADLGLKLRLAISHEHAERKSNWLDALSLKWDNAVRPMLVQVSAGFAGAVEAGWTAAGAHRLDDARTGWAQRLPRS